MDTSLEAKIQKHQVIGNVINQCARYNSWNIDELIYIDISYTKKL